ncbi:hypothetical protein GKQ38_02975 [Candidatus Nanohaloarchaea archaeon]|nr:hypothetical protein GKQ38_02975 [Candidatus Nanohaloarchaea archaeon]
MSRSKGQFMIISAVIISLIVMATAAAMTQVQNQRYSPDTEAYYVNMIQDEALQVDQGSPKDIRNFNKMVNSISRYSASSVYWNRDSSTDCFNVTLRNPRAEIRLTCVPVN